MPGGYGLNLIQLDPDIEVVHIEFVPFMAEITLVLVLFTDASRIDLSLLKQEGYKIPVRRVVVCLPRAGSRRPEVWQQIQALSDINKARSAGANTHPPLDRQISPAFGRIPPVRVMPRPRDRVKLRGLA